MRTDQVECITFRKNLGKYEFLLLKRIKEKGGFWQPPCGGVEDETIKEASLRELHEETGISEKDIIKKFDEFYTFTIDKHYLTGKKIPPLTEHVFAFEVKPKTEITFNKNIYVEHEKYTWANYENAQKLLKWDSNKKALEKIMRILKKDENPINN